MTKKTFKKLLSYWKDHMMMIKWGEDMYYVENINGELFEFGNYQLSYLEVKPEDIIVLKPVQWYEN